MKPGKTAMIAMMVLLAGLFAGTSIAADGEAAEPAVQAAPSEPVPVEVEPSAPIPPQPELDEAAAAEAMDDLLDTREAAPIIEPVQNPSEGAQFKHASPAASVDIDPAVLGIAPGDDPPPLRREGEFIVNRRGRLVRSAESGHRLFVFESDSKNAPELPLVMQACQLLETMEDTVDRRGDATTFILSGQVHTYRGANFLLPTMMKIAVDTGNLTN
jgi:hypothetical protein